MGDKPQDQPKPDDLVITPGGPRPRDRVHRVGPGDAVRGDLTGEPRVISLAQEGTENMAQDLVLTPGGPRPRSQVHLIEPGHILDATGGRLRKIDPSGQVVADYGALTVSPANSRQALRDAHVQPGATPATPGPAPALGSGWIAYAGWTNTTGHPISSFSTTWIVPPAPATQSGQTIFLFNGIEDAAFSWILQPVLQWGVSGAGGGNYWAVASWYVDGAGGNAFPSQLTQVNPGDTLVGVMTLTGQSGGLFSYNCQFQGIANSGHAAQNISQLVWCNETLEAYGVTRCSDYPNTTETAFRAANIQTGRTTPTVTWAPVNRVTDCGQHAVVVSNSVTAGEVDVYYRNPMVSPRVPGRAQVGVVSRSADKLDIFATDAGGAIRTAAWEPDFSDGWHGWWTLNGGRAAPGAPVTAVSRSADKLDVFVIGTDNHVYTAAWEPDFADGWHGWWGLRGGVAAPGAYVTAVSRSADKLDVFVVGTDNHVYTAAWEPDFADGWHGWWALGI